MFCYNCMNEKGDARICPYCHLDQEMEPAAHHLRPGTVLCGRYIVGYAIGEGGFGITYIGRDTNLDIRIAVKEFYPAGYTNRNTHAGDTVRVASGRQRDYYEKGKARFLLEARNVAKFIDEPGIVDVRDYFEENGTAYIIMEYLDGIDLNRYLNANGPLPAERAFELMLPVMHSLEKINAAGIIHRDISPDNIMYLRDGSLKLMDFGSARYFANAENEMSVLLKQGYSPEEQYRKNGEQGPWTDVYGMCATLYRAITGQVPVDGLDRMHNDTLQPPSALGAEISPTLEKVLMYGLAVFRENRCHDMTELISLTKRALSRQPVRIGATMPSDIPTHRVADAAYKDAVSHGLGKENGYGDSYTAQTPSAEPPGRKKSPLIPIIVIAAVALVLIAGAVTFFLTRDGSSEPAPTEAPTADPAGSPTESPLILPEDVSGMKLDRAMRVLKEQGFDVSVEYIASDLPLNYVVSQSPPAGTPLAPGATIILYLPEQKATEPPTAAPTAAPTDAPTAEPTEETAYICLCYGGMWFHRSDSRVSECYPETIPFGEEVQYMGITSGEFMMVRYGGKVGWALSKYLVPESKSVGAGAVYDREYNEPITCLKDAVLYVSPDFRKSIRISAGEHAVQVGYCPSNQSDHVGDYYEIYYRDQVYCLPYTILHDYFDYDNS